MIAAILLPVTPSSTFAGHRQQADAGIAVPAPVIRQAVAS